MKLGDAFIRNDLDRSLSIQPYIIIIERLEDDTVFTRKLIIELGRNSVIHYSQRWRKEEIKRLFNSL